MARIEWWSTICDCEHPEGGHWWFGCMDMECGCLKGPAQINSEAVAAYIARQPV